MKDDKVLDELDHPKVGYQPVSFPQTNTEKPYFSETLESVVGNNDFVNIYGGLKTAIRQNFLADAPDDGFDYYAEDHYAGIPIQYQSGIARAVATGSLKEVQKARQAVFSDLEEQDILGRSGFVGGALSFASGVISPTTLIPLGASLKYAQMSKGFVSGMKQIVPTAVASSVISRSAEAMNHETFGAKEWFQGVMIDSVLNSGLGAIVGTKKMWDAKNIQKLQGSMQAHFEDVDIKIQTGPKGEFQSYKAEAKGGSVSAARVQTVQSLLDNGIAKIGENTFFKKAFGASPVVKGLTSQFNTIRQLTNRMYRHNLVTGSIEKGYVEQVATAQDIHLDYKGLSDAVQVDTKNLWLKYIGIDKGVFKGTRAWNEARKKGLLFEEQFNQEICVAMRNGDAHAIPEVAEAAQNIRKKLYEPIFNKLVELERLDPNIDVATAISYLNRIYDKSIVTAHYDEFIDIGIQHFLDCNTLIREHTAPLNILKGNIKNLKDTRADLKKTKGKMSPEVYKEQIKNADEAIAKAKLELQTKTEELQTLIDQGKVPLKLLTGREQYAPEHVKMVEELNQPVVDAKERLRVAKESGDKKLIRDAKNNLADAKLRLKQTLLAEELPPEIFYKTKSGNVKLVNPKKKPWFRKETKEEDIRAAVKEIADTILEENEEQMSGRIFGQVSKGGSANPLKERSYLIEDEKIQKFLVNNVNTLADNYANGLGKVIGLDEMYKKYALTPKDGKQSLVKMLREEYDGMRAKVLEQADSPERTKELLALKKEFESAEGFMSDMFKTFMGNYVDLRSPEKRTTTALRNYFVSTQLGALLLTSLTDLTLPLFRINFQEYLMEGVIPTLKNFKKLIIDKKAQAADFADARVALETALGGMMDEKWGAGTQYQPKTLWERIPQNLAKLSGNINFSNQFSDITQTMVAMVSQSKTLRDLETYIKTGHLGQKESERLGKLALNPADWGQRIWNQMNKYGEKVDGAWIANTRNWSDVDAAQAFRIALNRDVKASLSIQNSFDMPMWFRKPVIDCITQYMSWGFGATNNLAIPLLQRFDAEKAAGIFAVMSLGAFIGPLRQLASGREVDLSPTALMGGALFDSGVLGHNGDILSKLNSMLRIPYLEHLKQDKYRMKTPWQILGGPLGGTLETAQRMVNMFLSGEINQNDMARSIKLLPYADNVLLRKPMSVLLKNSGLPETAAEARALQGE